MAVLKCKMCGGNLLVDTNIQYAQCESCGTQQTVPDVQDEELQNMFNRANALRIQAEFDKAADIYERIIEKKSDEAEAYWGLILCKYGIEYVEDPKSQEGMITCHRTSYDSVTADEDYKMALQYAKGLQHFKYTTAAKKIDSIQKEILALAQQEEPYDVFICYKETDESGNRTQDSVIANDLYYELVQEGFKVFYSAITLEDKLGAEYEPYIFSALNTAKVMLVVGTKSEYYNAGWVKNEWSRFLKLMKKDRSKTLIPCYRDMDPYEMPEEFAHFQAQDMSKIGFINDLIRGVKKLIRRDGSEENESEKSTQESTGGTTATAQLKRGYIALDDDEWEKADQFFEEALNLNPEYAEAYLGKFLARRHKKNLAELISIYKDQYGNAESEQLEARSADTEHIDNMVETYTLEGYLEPKEIRSQYDYEFGYYSEVACREEQKQQLLGEIANERVLNRVYQYADDEFKKQLDAGKAEITAVLDERIANAQEAADRRKNDIIKAYEEFISETDKKVEAMNAEAKNKREQDYQALVASINTAQSLSEYEKLQTSFLELRGYKDSREYIIKCKEEIDRLQNELVTKQKHKERNKKILRGLLIAAIVCAVVLSFVFGLR